MIYINEIIVLYLHMLWFNTCFYLQVKIWLGVRGSHVQVIGESRKGLQNFNFVVFVLCRMRTTDNPLNWFSAENGSIRIKN